MSESSNPLPNPLHEMIVQKIVSGTPPHLAYLAAFPNVRKSSARSAVSRLLLRPQVYARLDYLKQCNAESSQWTRTQAMDILRNIAENPEKSDRDRINAVNLLNQMCGFTEPEKKIISQTTFFQFISPDGAMKGPNQ